MPVYGLDLMKFDLKDDMNTVFKKITSNLFVGFTMIKKKEITDINQITAAKLMLEAYSNVCGVLKIVKPREAKQKGFDYNKYREYALKHFAPHSNELNTSIAQSILLFWDYFGKGTNESISEGVLDWAKEKLADRSFSKSVDAYVRQLANDALNDKSIKRSSVASKPTSSNLLSGLTITPAFAAMTLLYLMKYYSPVYNPHIKNIGGYNNVYYAISKKVSTDIYFLMKGFLPLVEFSLRFVGQLNYAKENVKQIIDHYNTKLGKELVIDWSVQLKPTDTFLKTK